VSESLPEEVPQRVVLDAGTARILQAARADQVETIEVSLDLGVSRTPIVTTATGLQTSGGLLRWEDIDTIADDEHGCYELSAAGCERIQCMSSMTGRLASLYATSGPPALLLSGTLMHRIKGVHPGQDTQLKLAPLPRLQNCRVLDTATGLGYTTIEAVRRGAASVHTVELDPAVIQMQRRNPWSAELFLSDRIDRQTGDIAQVIEDFEEDQFDRILHDPPVLELAGDLYGGAFYRQLHRTLSRRGHLFHYIGNLDSPSGKRTVPGVILRLEEAGFTDVKRRPEAFGVSARA
jgi:uncharacterized protein